MEELLQLFLCDVPTSTAFNRWLLNLWTRRYWEDMDVIEF